VILARERFEHLIPFRGAAVVTGVFLPGAENYMLSELTLGGAGIGSFDNPLAGAIAQPGAAEIVE